MAAGGASHVGGGALWTPKEQTLLRAAGWGNPETEELMPLFFQRCEGGDRLPFDNFCNIMLSMPGVNLAQCNALFRALDADQHGSLTFAQFVFGVCAMSPQTKHQGEWQELRMRYIFRMFDENFDGVLDVNELKELIWHIRIAANLDAHEDVLTVEAYDVIRSCGGTISITQPQFLAKCKLNLTHVFRLSRALTSRDLGGKNVGASSEAGPAATTAASIPSAPAPTKWNCIICTFENHAASQKCTMCGAFKPLEPMTIIPTTPSGTASAAAASATVASPTGNSGLTASEIAAFERIEAERTAEVVAALQTLSVESRAWLDACVAAADGVEAPLLAATQHRERRLTALEADMLTHETGRRGVFLNGATLVDLALQFNHHHVVALLCPAVAPEQAAKRQPAHVSPDIAERVRILIGTALQRDAAGGIVVLAPHLAAGTMFLPEAVHAFSRDTQDRLMAQTLDLAVQQTLETSSPPAINWAPSLPPTSRRVALWNGATGDCLLDALCQAMWGVTAALTPLLQQLRDALCATTAEARARLLPHWEPAMAADMRAVGAVLNEQQLDAEWQTLAQLALQPKTALDKFHVFVLAQMLRRPILVLSVSDITDMHGAVLQQSDFQGFYLPLLWPASECNPNPLVLGYTRGHFSALLPICGALASPDAAAVAADASPEVLPYHAEPTWVPVSAQTTEMLPVRFALPQDADRDLELVMQYVTVEEQGGLLCVRQDARVFADQADMLRAWLAFFAAPPDQ